MNARSMISVSFMVFALASAGALGCALTEKAEVMDVHYYTAETTARPVPAASASAAVPGDDGEAVAAPPLRLGRVSAGAHLGKKVVFRSSSVELGMYDDKRWTERPDEYVRRAMSTALFDAQRATQSLGGAAPTLDLELLAFEEIVQKDKPHRGRVSLRYSLHDEQRVLVSDVVTVELDAASGDTDKVVRAIAQALAQVSERIAERVSVRLGEATKTAER
jgi:cholesterol transport system auxiliary component